MVEKACRYCCNGVTLELNKNCRLVNRTIQRGKTYTRLFLEFEFYCARCGGKTSITMAEYFDANMTEGFPDDLLVLDVISRNDWLKDLQKEYEHAGNN